MALAVVEGLALVVAECVSASAARPSSLTVCGGGAASDLWCQKIADATGLLVLRPSTAEVGALGAALVAAADSGLGPSLPDAGRAAAQGGRDFAPRAGEAERLAHALKRMQEVRSTGR